MRDRLLAVVARVREMGRRHALEAERDEEFRFHIEMETERNRRRGMSGGEARRAALIAFGGVQRYRDATREARGFVLFDDTSRDIRHAARRLARSPSFSLGVATTLGVGMGTAVAIGALVYGVMLRPLPYPEPDRLVQVTFRTPGLDDGREHAHSQASYIHFKEAGRSFASIGGYHVNDAVNLTDGDAPQRVSAITATPGLLQVLQVVPARGRLLSQADAELAGAIPVMITHGLWQRRYGGDSSIVGRSIEVNRRSRRVVGVLPADFAFPAPMEAVWLPLDELRPEQWGGPPSLQSRYLEVIARLRDDASIASARAELNAAIPRFSDRFPSITPDDVARSRASAEVQPLKDATIAPVRQHLRLLGLTLVFVLLIAAANVTTLFLLRAQRSRHEIALARALGARPIDLARRFLAEGALLGLVGGLLAIPIVAVAIRSHFGFTAREIPRLHEVALSGATLATVVVLALALGVFVALVAFMRAGNARLGENLKTGSARFTGGWRLAQRVLVATQVATALTLLLGAALLGKSLWNLRQVDLGFRPEGRAMFEVTLPYLGYEDYARTTLFHRSVLERLRATGGVASAEAAMELPLIQQNPGELSLEFDAVGTARSERAAVNMASPDYFRVMGIPLLHGRSFAVGDVRAETPAIVLSASLARALFGETDVVGRLVRAPSPGDEDVFNRVVGVVGDVPRWRIEDGPARMAYYPLLADADGVPGDSVRLPIVMRTARYLLRTDASLAQLAPALRAAVREVDPRVPVTNLATLPRMVDAATARVRLTMLLLAVCAAAALLLGMIGIYSVVSYTAAGRQREFGVRLALGAEPLQIQRMVLRDGLVLALLGLAAGVVSALWGARVARSMLYEVSATDPGLYVAVTALLILVASAASLAPARRAARIDPVCVMKAE